MAATPTPTAVLPTATPYQVVRKATATPTPTQAPVAAVAPTSATTPEGIKYGGILQVSMASGHVGFDPPLVETLPDIVTIQHTYEPLVFRNPDLSLRPALAESWEINQAGTQWTFRLRKGVRFIHGKEFKAEDVIFTFNRLFTVKSPLASVMARPRDIVALDDYTVRFDFSSPNAVLLESLVKHHAYITPSDVDPARFVTEDFGTGPFIITGHVPGERIVMVRNPNYWDQGLPYLDGITLLTIPDSTTRTAMLKTGRIDAIHNLDIASVNTLRDYPDTLVAQAAGGSYMNLAMDVREPPFDNILVRKALQAATHRGAILQEAQSGLGGIAYDHPILPGDPVFNPSCKPPDYDPTLARALLAQAGYPDGIDLTLYTSNAGAPMVEMATVFKEKATPAGINIDIVVMPENTFWSDGWMVKPFTTVWWSGRPPYEAINVLYRSDATWNESYYNNPTVDQLLDRALGIGYLADQKVTYGKLQCLMIEDVPRIIPVFRPVLLGLRKDVRGVEPMWDATLSVHRAWLDR